jgi:plastocyanin
MKKSLIYPAIIAVLIVAVAGVSMAADDTTITGKITLKGMPPSEVEIDMGADAQCKAMHTETVKTKRYVVGSKGELANVFVYAKEGVTKSYDPPKQPVVLDQKGCMYQPYILGIQVGQTFEIDNSDDNSHNVHILPNFNAEKNFGQPIKGTKSTYKFTKPEIGVKIKCDVHPWMFAFISAVPHPFFAVTGQNGAFKISSLPPGDYTIEAWHLKAGTQTQKVRVGAGETKSIDITLEAK